MWPATPVAPLSLRNPGVPLQVLPPCGTILQRYTMEVYTYLLVPRYSIKEEEAARGGKRGEIRGREAELSLPPPLPLAANGGSGQWALWSAVSVVSELVCREHVLPSRPLDFNRIFFVTDKSTRVNPVSSHREFLT